jgi:hypothetical protein
VITPGRATNAGDTFGVRYKGVNGGGEVYLGVNDLGSGPNRVEADTIWPNGPRPFSFAFDGTTLGTTLPGASGPPSVPGVDLSRPAVSCPAPDQLELRIRAQANSATTAVANLVVNGVPLGGFGPVTAVNTDYFALDQYFTISGDFSGPFTITGLLDTSGWNAGNESNQLQLIVGCSS